VTVAGFLYGFKKSLERHAPTVAHRLRCLRQLDLALRESEMEVLGGLIDRAGMVVDIGANFGIYSEFFARRLHVRKVLAVEPIPSLAAYLTKILPANVEVLNVALSDSSGTAKIRIPCSDKVVYESLATIEAGNVLSNLSFKEYMVKLARLDDCVKEKVSFLKIDVEGHEAAVLRGACRVLENDRPNVLVEIEDRHNPNSFAEIMAIMKKLDYRCYYYRDRHLIRVPFNEGGISHTVPGVINYIFLA
jgi:FkbM family methyltransferase